MCNDYIPTPDTDFDQWFTGFAAYVKDNAGALGVTAAAAQKVAEAQKAWDDAFQDHQQVQASALASTNAKVSARGTAEDLVRPLVRFIQARPQAGLSSFTIGLNLQKVEGLFLTESVTRFLRTRPI